MRSFRVVSAVAAALVLTAIGACKDSTTVLGDITCVSTDPVCPPGDLVLGFNGATGAPTITPGTPGTTVNLSTSAYAITGTTNSTLPGYWLLVSNNNLSAWGVLAVSGSVYSAEVPLFCGEQRLMYTFNNPAGRSYYVVAVNRTGCTGPSAFRVQLTWTSDPSSDLDLHLLRPGGSFTTSNDCYFGNCTLSSGLEWGATGSAGNPVLDVDDVDGYGPENIFLNAGAEAGQYRIIVHNWDGTIGEVATVKIYFNDVEAARYTSLPLDATSRRYWEVAKVDVTQRIITAVGNYSSTAPVTLGGPPAGVPAAK